MASTYRIVDEPTPGPAAQFVAAPMFPLLALMLGGAWLAWPWYIVNGWAMGSATRVRETVLVLGTTVCTAALAFIILGLEADKILTGVGIQLAVLLLTVLKLATAYWLHTLQAVGHQLFLYVRGGEDTGNGNAWGMVLLGMFARGWVLKQLPDLLAMVLA